MKQIYLALYYDWIHMTEKLSDEEFGRLVRDVAAYAERGVIREQKSPVVEIAYAFICNTVKRYKEKAGISTEETREIRAEIISEAQEAEYPCEKENKKSTTPPTLDEVENYFKKRGYSSDAVEFHNYYESVGWRVGRNRMESWRPSADNWERRAARASPKPQSKARYGDFDPSDAFRRALERSYSS